MEEIPTGGVGKIVVPRPWKITYNTGKNHNVRARLPTLPARKVYASHLREDLST